jgi:hypothetical protein
MLLSIDPVSAQYRNNGYGGGGYGGMEIKKGEIVKWGTSGSEPRPT